MTDEPTRRMFPERDALVAELDATRAEPAAPTYSGVPDRPSARPEAFSEREQPTLASPNSLVVPAQGAADERLQQLDDRIRQLEVDLENVYAQLEHLSDAFNSEQLRGRAARMGRYLLWGALIAAMATFWMMLRLRAGTP